MLTRVCWEDEGRRSPGKRIGKEDEQGEGERGRERKNKEILVILKS